MEFDLSLKNNRVRVWLWLMIPAFIITFLLFVFLPRELPGIVSVLPLIICYFIYLGWMLFRKEKIRDEKYQK
ncbi:hypothetical protein CFK37_18265 [Virgibacillus phasianinus]|uniref:Uncharacterized protein n=1 Tax=Virgibacillus phasianinus TaxID=2017483 RepID=A0A220U895_9BACI|nr:hypothetical protein [Virgibacillus phasianinus]ASK63963.1 hypothetical protein CFK37_18265 [Virgibacillus phasianinus]